MGYRRKTTHQAPSRNDVPTGTGIGSPEALLTTWFRSKRRGAELSAPEEVIWSGQHPAAAGFGKAARCRFDGAAQSIGGGISSGTD